MLDHMYLLVQHQPLPLQEQKHTADLSEFFHHRLELVKELEDDKQVALNISPDRLVRVLFPRLYK